MYVVTKNILQNRQTSYILINFNHLKFPKWFVGLILGRINPLTIGNDAEKQWVLSFICQS